MNRMDAVIELVERVERRAAAEREPAAAELLRFYYPSKRDMATCPDCGLTEPECDCGGWPEDVED